MSSTGQGEYSDINDCSANLLGQLLAFFKGHYIEYQLCGGMKGGKGGNVTCAGLQVTMCDPIWHVSSFIDRTAFHLTGTISSYVAIVCTANP